MLKAQALINEAQTSCVAQHFGGLFKGVKHGRRNLRHQSLNVVSTGHFCLGWWSNFVGSESGQKQSLKLVQNIWSTAQFNTPPHPPPPNNHTLSLEVEGGEVREKVERQQHTSIVPWSRGATVHKLGWKYQPWVNVSPVYKNLLNTMPQSLLTGQF